MPGVLERGVEWLKRYQDEQLRHLANVDDKGNVIDKNKPAKQDADNLDALVYMVLVDADVKSDTMRDFLYRDRTQLAVYGKRCTAWRCTSSNEAEKLAMIMQNIDQFVVEDDENQTAYLNLPQNIWWYWYGSEIEANAYYLKLLAATEPKSEVAPRLVKYLLNNRKHATYWNSTRDTALVHRGARRLPQGQRRGQAGPDRRSLARRQEAQGSEDQRREPVHVRQHVRARRRRPARRAAHGRAAQDAARARSTATATSPTSRWKTTSARPAWSSRSSGSTTSSRRPRSRSTSPAAAARRSSQKVEKYDRKEIAESRHASRAATWSRSSS